MDQRRLSTGKCLHVHNRYMLYEHQFFYHFYDLTQLCDVKLLTSLPCPISNVILLVVILLFFVTK